MPLAIVEAGQGRRSHVLMANDLALAAGVCPGQSLASALALAPQLLSIERDRQAEAELLHAAACAALSLTPAVVVREHGLLAEVAGSLRLFGGRRALLRRLAVMVREAGLRAAIDWAGTLQAAWLLARQGKPGSLPRHAPENALQRLDEVELSLMDSARHHAASLRDMGCQTLGDVRRLPRAGLRRRFGDALLQELDRAYGTSPDPQVWLTLPERFEERLELPARIDNVGLLLAATQRLMTRLAGWLAVRCSAVLAFTLMLHHHALGVAQVRVQHPPTAVTVRLASPVADVTHLLGLVREHFARQVLSAPVEELVLRVDESVLRQTSHDSLFTHDSSFTTRREHTQQRDRLFETLMARLGAEAVQRVQSVADHRPEFAWKAVAVHPVQGQTMSVERIRPTWLLPQPLALNEHNHRPVYGTSLILLTGPERIESGWWDDRLVTRDYFIAANQVGQLLWVFRERSLLHSAHAWYLHGLFA